MIILHVEHNYKSEFTNILTVIAMKCGKNIKYTY